MILLAGILIVIAYLVFSTQTALLATVGQEAGREATSPVFADFVAIRSGLASVIEMELKTDPADDDPQCPDPDRLLTDWKGRVETMLAMISQLESNRGHSFRGAYLSSTLVGGVLTTEVEIYLTDGDAMLMEEVRFRTECDP